MNVPGLRTALRAAFASLSTIEAQEGIWWYAQGCKKDHVPADREVLAEVHGSVAIFKRDEVVEQAVTAAMAGTFSLVPA